MLLAAGLALVTIANPGDRRDRAVGQFVAATAAVPALGPFISGALVDFLSWRWLFVIPLVLPLGALAITRAIPETPRAAGRRPDVQGSMTALLALSGLSVVLILGPARATPELVAVAAVVGLTAAGWFIRVEQRTPAPLLPLRLLRRRPFVGANVIWLLGCMTSWAAVFFLAVHLQVTLGLRPITAGMLLTPIYLVMMAGSPVAAALARRFGRHPVVVAGLAVYAAGLWLLSTIDAAATVPWGVLAPLAVFAVGMATLTAPLAAAAMSALDDADQGIASGVNNAMGQLAGLLAIIVLPALAGLAGATRFTGPAFSAAYPRALQAAAVIAALGIPVALLTLPSRVRRAPSPTKERIAIAPPQGDPPRVVGLEKRACGRQREERGMANKVVEASASLAAPGPVGQHPETTPEPTWVTWAPWGAVAWALAYGAVRIWWAIRDAPSPPPLGTDLLVFSDWGAVGLCVAVLGVALALKMARWRRPLWIAAWAVSAALLMASALLLLDVVGALSPGLGVGFHPVAFVSRAAALGGAVLMGAAAEGYRRRWRSVWVFCGRTGAGGHPMQLPRWAWWGAYAAVAGCVVRLGAQMAVGFAELQGSGWSLFGFEAGFVLAGTVLPLALVHRWGRVFPTWMPALAGRRVPRWLLLAPAFGIAGAMTAYFGFTFVMLSLGTLTGTWDAGDGSLSLGFFWVAVPAYLTWGLGLGAAAVGYYRVTRPRCQVCGQ